ncbi:MAG TPA: type II CAAX endopeptidase family protein [Candidatus Avamphibacillus sp.]|nr:type II CAAX endopeptidase family protein [Candidatus Avamphibacillus sp.]
MEQEIENAEQKKNIKQVSFNILKLIGFMILALVPLQILVILISFQNQFSTMVNSVLGIVYFILTIIIIMFLWKRYIRYSKENVQKIGLRDFGFAFLFFLIARVIAVVGTLSITWIHGEETSANDEALMSITENSGEFFAFYFVLFILSLSILIPIAEELTYRGIGTNLFFRKKSFWLPLLVTSTVFGLVHTPTNIISFLLYGFMGVVFFLAYYRRKNILDSMLVHIFNNGLAAIVLALDFIGVF